MAMWPRGQVYISRLAQFVQWIFCHCCLFSHVFAWRTEEEGPQGLTQGVLTRREGGGGGIQGTFARLDKDLGRSISGRSGYQGDKRGSGSFAMSLPRKSGTQ